jgi:hypothetical protein
VNNSPAEYIAELQRQNRILRRESIRAVHEKQQLELQLAQEHFKLQQAQQEYMRLRTEMGIGPHDYEPCRPGLSEVD